MSIVQIFTESQFNDIIENKTLHNKNHILIDFGAVWCGSCTKIEPSLLELQKSLSNIYFCKIDIECTDLSNIVDKYNIKKLPTFLLFKTGQYECLGTPLVTTDINNLKCHIQKLSQTITRGGDF